ncbi:tRNA pseudouridine synthase Pus10-like [Watersipora subatra]|uniref:tRNA pseudouridine synthase Pus10-like n=1 Tax=Watersipora subatra TaxID=2589382 RepID=UPI00355C1ACD
MSLLPFDKSLPFLEDIWKKLESHLCFWCICRHLGIDSISFYKQTISEAMEELLATYPQHKEIISESPAASPTICGGCYEVLTSFTEDRFLVQIAEEVKSQETEFEHFSCSIGLPVASVVREFTFLLMCADVCPDAYEFLPIEQVPSVKDVWKWMCGSRLESKLNKRFSLEHLDILLNFEQKEVDSECCRLEESFRDRFRKRKGKADQFTRANVLNALLSVSRAKLRTLVAYPPDKLSHVSAVSSILCTHNSIYVAGRYNKYSRQLSQSPWIIEGERKGLETSVSEIISHPLVEYTRADKHEFSSSGREDIDVQMLGSGRPFMLQLHNPRKLLSQSTLLRIQEEISQSSLVKVRDLQTVSRADTDILKDLEGEKRKTYSALCISDSDISQQVLDGLGDIKDLVLEQKTPIRVLHRRALAIRPRTVYWMKAQPVDGSDKKFNLTLETQAGTYVKEFVHSDFGRTVPSLGGLLGGRQLDILALDVLSVHVDWPPSLKKVQ